jgi:hypothetical protein
MWADTFSAHSQKHSGLMLKKSDSTEILNIKRKTDTANVKTSIDTINVKVFGINHNKKEKKDYINLFLPILTLLLGFFLNRGYEYFAEKRRIKKDGERWIAELRSLEEPLDAQISSLKEFLTIHEQDKFETPEIKVFQILNCEVFKSLDKSNLLKYLESRHKDFPKAIQLSNNFHTYISAIAFSYDDITRRFNDYLNQASTHVDLFNAHLHQMMQSFAFYGVILEKKTNESPTNNDTFRQIHELFKKYIYPHTEDGEIDLFSLQSNFLKPLLDIISVNRLDENLKEISIHSSNCNLEIKAVRAEKEYLIKNFTKAIGHLMKLKENLVTLLEKLEQKY